MNSTSCQFVRLFVLETNHFVIVVAHLAVLAALILGMLIAFALFANCC